MLNENRLSTAPIIALIAINFIYLILVILDFIDGIFALWIFFIFLSLLPFIIKDKRNTIAIIVFLIPLEITKTLIPFFQTVEVTEGVFNSVFDLARLFMLYSFIIWFLKDLHSFTPFIKHRISYIVLVFIGYYLLSALAFSPDLSKGLTEAFRYVIYFLFFTMVIQFIDKPADIAVVFKVMIVIAVILSLEGIAEYVFDYKLWIDKGRRASATFLDPNIFARFLDIVIMTLLILRLKKIFIIKPQYMDISILLCGLALLFTVSRQGLAILFLTLFVVAFFMEKKTRNILLLTLLILLLITIPIVTEMMTVRQDSPELYDIGERKGLLLGGIMMFLGSPVFGVGAGGFQAAMIAKYLNFLPWGIGSSTLSHTYVITILAELGIVGFTIFCVFLLFLYKQFRINFRTEDHTLKTYSLILLAVIIVIFIGAQAEGKFFEDPLLWLFLGMCISMEKIIKHEVITKNPDHS
ncbi:MAG: O-antigen ligase family protein [Candidatus Marinimicrobia bacterium]|nr:O-antigen ligase family protein [Candidatus Neomarinimicrobiota bacterium]